MTTTKPMALEAISWSDSVGVGVRVGMLRDTGVPAIETAADSLLSMLAEYRLAQREFEAARRDVERLPDAARAAAVEAGQGGSKVDTKRLRRKANEAQERLEDTDLERVSLAAALYEARRAYLAALQHHRPHLLANARQVADTAVLSLASAREIARRAADALQASIVVLGAAPMLAQGDPSPQLVKPARTGADDFDDAGHPAVWAAMADEPLVKAIWWATRWLEHATSLEKTWSGEDAEPVVEQAEADESDEG